MLFDRVRFFSIQVPLDSVSTPNVTYTPVSTFLYPADVPMFPDPDVRKSGDAPVRTPAPVRRPATDGVIVNVEKIMSVMVRM